MRLPISNKIELYIMQLQKYFKRWMLSWKPLRHEKYHRQYKMSIRQWLLFHHKEVVFKRVRWMGVQILKNPLDAWVYQEIICEIKPDIIVEIGSKYGGSTKYFADLLNLIGKGAVISIDIDRSKYSISHPRVITLTGDSASFDIVEAVADVCSNKTVMVIHDGNHRKTQVLKDLYLYAPLVTVGSYFIVEDGIVDLFHYGDGLGFAEEGPLSAVTEFLMTHPEFIVDEERERYLMTYNPNGFLKRIEF